MGSFSFTTEIKEDRTLQLPAGTPIGRVTVAITPAGEAAPTGRRLLAKLLDLQAAIPAAEGLSQEQIDTALELDRASTRLQPADAIHLAAAMHWRCDALLTNDRAFQLSHAPIEVLRPEPDQP
jgi:predicted nucleic acid-binding protein